MNKRIICYLSFILICLLLAGCISKPNTAENLPLPEITEISFHGMEQADDLSSIQELDTGLYEAFLSDFTALPYHTYWNDPVDEVGNVFIRISFQDGSYYAINHYCTIYNNGSSGKDLRVYYGSEDFAILWNRYCSTEYPLQ